MRALIGDWTTPTGRYIAQWYTQQTGLAVSTSFSAAGFLDSYNRLIGAAIFFDYNGSNIELTFYGKRILTKEKIKFIGDYVFNRIKCNRLTTKTRRKYKSRCRMLIPLGFIYETTLKSYYGLTKDDDAIVYTLFKDRVPEWILSNG